MALLSTMMALVLVGCSDKPTAPVASRPESAPAAEKQEQQEDNQVSVSSTVSQKEETPTIVTTPPEQAPPTPPQPELDKWAGFRGLPWGTNIADMKDMVLTTEDARNQFYARMNDKLSIGDAQLMSLSYVCYQGRLCGIWVELEGSSNYGYLKDALFARYGTGVQRNAFIEDWAWGGPRRLASGPEDVLMVLTYKEISEVGLLLMSYIPMYNEKKSADAERAKAADKDF